MGGLPTNPTINGQEYQHATIDLQIAALLGVAFSPDDFTAISYETGAEKKPYNAGTGKVVSYTIDNQKTEGSITMLKSSWLALKKKLKTSNPGLGIGQIEMTWLVTFGNSLSTLKTETLLTVMFQKDPTKSTSDQAALMVEVPLFIGDVLDEDGASFINYSTAGV